jgi:hypothetical protein
MYLHMYKLKKSKNWDRYYDYKNILAKKFIENIGVFLLKILLFFAKI